MSTPGSQYDEDLARRVYAYFIFRLRQPEDAERLTRLSFERIWREAMLRRDVEQEPDLPVFASARAVISENPRARGASRVVTQTRGRAEGDHHASSRLTSQVAMALGRLHGRERDALALRFGAELSIGEIAELIDRTPAEVKQRVARGVRSLIDLGVLPKEDAPRKSAAKGSGPRGAQQGKSEKNESTE